MALAAHLPSASHIVGAQLSLVSQCLGMEGAAALDGAQGLKYTAEAHSVFQSSKHRRQPKNGFPDAPCPSFAVR